MSPPSELTAREWRSRRIVTKMLSALGGAGVAAPGARRYQRCARVAELLHSGERREECQVERQPIARFMFPARHSRAEEYARRVERALPPGLRGPDVRAGLVEALTNAILHGVFGIAYNEGDLESYLDAIEQAELSLAGTSVIGVTVCAGEDGADVIVNDFGEGFDWKRARAYRGRGLGILNEVFEAVRWNQGGNCVRLTIGEKGGRK